MEVGGGGEVPGHRGPAPAPRGAHGPLPEPLPTGSPGGARPGSCRRRRPPGPGGRAGGLLEEGGESLRPRQGAGQIKLQDRLCKAGLRFKFKRWRSLRKKKTFV